MRTLPALLQAHLDGETTTLATCWLIEKKDGTFIRGTDHDVDIEIDDESPDNGLSGTYWAGSNITGSDVRSSADMSVDNMEVEGAIPTEDFIDVSVADIEAGLLDGAAVTVFFANWEDPNGGQIIIRRGYLGEISRDSDGRYKTEVRGLVQLLSQVFVLTYSDRCQVKRFGDAKCKFDLTGATFSGSVSSVTNRKRFDVVLEASSPTPSLGYFNGGELTFTTGANAGYMREVKLDAVGDVEGAFNFWEVFPEDVTEGDEFTVTPGCNRLFATCRDVHDNAVNYRGYGLFVPGLDAIARGADGGFPAWQEEVIDGIVDGIGGGSP